MHSEDVDGVEEADEDYEEYEDQDDEEATTLSRFSKGFCWAHHHESIRVEASVLYSFLTRSGPN
jgi:hypothetical protein